VYKDKIVDANKEVVPIVPENILKYFLPNSPSTKKVTSGNKGINAM
jgi:hypothetical protein